MVTARRRPSRVRIRAALRPLDRKLLRDLVENALPFAAVVAVVASGIAAYTAVSFSLKNLRLSRDVYYREARFADLEMRFDKAPEGIIERALAIPGVRDARARLIFQVSVDVPGNPDTVAARFVSLPDDRAHEGANGRAIINDIVVTEGRIFSPDAPDEILVDPEFLLANELRIGDAIEATIQDRKRSLRIVGTARTPEFVFVCRSASEYLPDPRHFGIAFVSQSFAQAAYGYEGAVNELLFEIEDPSVLEDVVDRAERLVDPYGHIFTFRQRDQVSNAILRYELQGLEVSARITPAVFLSVAAIVTHIMLSRLIARQRGIIGILKSFGYSSRTILLHYTAMSVVVLVAGAIVGSAVGNVLAGVMLSTYEKTYHFPSFVSRTYWDVNLAGTGIAAIFAAATGLAAARRVLALQPAEAMRPAVPDVGRQVDRLLPRAILRRLSPRARFIARNLARRPGRSLASATGLALSTAIIVFAYSMSDMTESLVGTEFRDVQRYDLRAIFDQGRAGDAVRDLARIPGVVRAEPVLEIMCRLRHRWRKKEVLLTGLAIGTTLRAVRDERGNDIPLGGSGIVIDRYLARLLGARIGDEISVKPHFKGQPERMLRIADLSIDQMWIPGYAEIERLGRFVDEPGMVTGAFLDVERGARAEVETQLKDIPGIASVEATERLVDSFRRTISGPLDFMTNMLTFFAGVIAFSVIFNVTTVNVTERQRELATLRVLGFSMREVLGLIRWETGILVAAGIAAGPFIGHWLAALVVRAYDSDLYRLTLVIYPRTYVLAMTLAAGFAFASALATRRKVTGVSFIEALKLRD